jgi:alcohol dehydrogenase (cytochrome c)
MSENGDEWNISNDNGGPWQQMARALHDDIKEKQRVPQRREGILLRRGALKGLFFSRFVAVTFASLAVGLTSAAASAQQQSVGDWPQYANTMDGHRYSELTGISPTTVSKLVPAWSKQLGTPVSMEGTPIVKDGVMYVSTGGGALFALDARTGETKWSYQWVEKDRGKPCCGKDSRGVTLAGDIVVMPTLDAHLVALDTKTGALRWTATVVDWSLGYSITSPPLFVDGLLITGMSGGEFPTRGFLAAYDPKTGKQVWRTYTVPTLADPEAASWQMSSGKTPHGGATWIPGTYDKELDTVYWGVGNPNPDFDPTAFKGTQLLYTDSVLALNPHTGKIKWSHKFTPRNIFDYDGVNENVVVDLPMNGKTVKAIAHADRDGYLFVIDRTNGKTIYVDPFVDHVTWAKIDRDGTVHPSSEIAAAAAGMHDVPFAPASLGGKNWQPTAYDPVSHILVIPAQEATGVLHPTATPDVPDEGVANTGKFSTPASSYAGSVVAYDLTTGKQIWKLHTAEGQAGGVMITNGVVFDSEVQGNIQAIDEKTGAVIWKTPKIGNGGITAPPITYSVNGTQYLAIEVGVGGLWPRIAAKEDYMKDIKPDSAVYVFALPH